MVDNAGSVAVARAIRKEFEVSGSHQVAETTFNRTKKLPVSFLSSLQRRTTSITACSDRVDVNISPHDLESVKSAVTSISAEMGHDVDRASFLARLLRELESRYLLIEEGEYEAVIREWKSLSCTLEHVSGSIR